MIYDTAIIGTGVAGLSAALNLKIHDKSIIWIGSKSFSDKIAKAERIDNYPGFVHASGEELRDAFRAHANAMGLEISERMVSSIVPFGDHYALMAGSDFFEAKTVILATGVAAAATLPGESEYLGKGVSYCATCDGNLYRGKTIAVICNAARFEHEVQFLASLAGKVYFFPTYKNPGAIGENVELVSQKAVQIIGERKVSAVALRSGETLSVDGVFCLRDSMTLSALLPQVETENRHIKVGRDMATNLPGIFAAGDCTGRPYQYAKAAGEGNIAAHSVIEYLAKADK